MTTEVVALPWAWVVVVVLSIASLFAVSNDWLGLVLLVLALVCAPLRGRLAIPRTAWMLWFLLCVGASAGLLADTRLSLQSGLLFPRLYIVVVALGGALLPALLRRHTRGEMWITLGMAGTMHMLCGLNFAPLVPLFGAMSAIWACCLALGGMRMLTGRYPKRASLLTLIPGVVLLAVFAMAYSFSERQTNFLMRLFSAGMDVSLPFPAQSRLNTLAQAESNPAVVARCFSKVPDQYLPARVYTRYNEGVWEADASKEVEGQAEGATFRFPIASGKPRQRDEFEINTSPVVLLSPRDALELRIEEPRLAQLPGHILELRGGDAKYRRYSVERDLGQSLAPAEDSAYLEQCSKAPKLSPEVLAIARQQVPQPGSVLERAEAVERWLQRDFNYGFGYDYAASADPIGDFLLKKPLAHCEIFASTMVLLLRAQGIPCRYLNGFVCVEQSWDRDYWVIRVRDAHAWVEVWDGQRWTRFDPTPPAALAPPDTWRAWFESLREKISHSLRALGRMDFAAWVDWLWDRRGYWVAVWGVVLLAVVYRVVGQRQRKPQVRVPEHQWISELSKSLGRYELAREPWETLDHWADRLTEPVWGGPVAGWLRDYSAYRYGGAPEGDLQERWKQLLEILNKPRTP